MPTKLAGAERTRRSRNHSTFCTLGACMCASWTCFRRMGECRCICELAGNAGETRRSQVIKQLKHGALYCNRGVLSCISVSMKIITRQGRKSLVKYANRSSNPQALCQCIVSVLVCDTRSPDLQNLQWCSATDNVTIHPPPTKEFPHEFKLPGARIKSDKEPLQVC